MLKNNHNISFALLIVSTVSIAQNSIIKQPIAGVHPDKRPIGSAIITEHFKDANWYERALYGVSTPYPSSLQFLEDQGAWHTPFNKPGLKGAYDLRNWHKKK